MIKHPLCAVQSSGSFTIYTSLTANCTLPQSLILFIVRGYFSDITLETLHFQNSVCYRIISFLQRGKPILSPNCMILYMVSYSSDFRPKTGLAPVVSSRIFTHGEVYAQCSCFLSRVRTLPRQLMLEVRVRIDSRYPLP